MRCDVLEHRWEVEGLGGRASKPPFANLSWRADLTFGKCRSYPRLAEGSCPRQSTPGIQPWLSLAQREPFKSRSRCHPSK